jgi:hypothetical protein
VTVALSPFSPAAPLEADAGALSVFIAALFRYADSGAFVSWRAFSDGKTKQSIFIESSHTLDDGGAHLVEPATYWATKAAQHPEPVVFCPPIATFTTAKRAREIDLANGLALSVECDSNAASARLLLERLLGAATVVVASGGLWTDALGAQHDKLHLHWRLDEPTSTPEDHARLKRARILATRLVGGDATNIPAVHPIRWPGSWHRKSTPRLAHIVELQDHREITLTDALEALENAAAALPPEQRAQIFPADQDAGESTSELVRLLMSGESMHAPLCALAYRYLLGGMSDGTAVNVLRGMLDAIPPAARGGHDRWSGHYSDVPRTVRSAREKIGVVESVPAADVSGFLASFTPPAPPAIVVARPADRPSEIPAHLLSPPGVLADVVRFGLASSVRPVPIFAVQAALALGSVVCARRYVTSQRNYASLYFLNVAKSGTGKEEAKTTIERVLSAAGVRRLVGPSTYSSGGAVFSALIRKPAHIAIVDEFGHYMEAAAREFDSFRAETLKQLMEAFGRVHGDMSTPQYSTMTMTSSAAQEVEPKIIQRPAITMLAMTTPSTFYGAMRSGRIQDGFLNRFLIAEHTAPREPAREWQDIDVPASVIHWIRQMLAPHSPLDVSAQLEHIPDAAVVEFSPAALERTRSFEREMLQLSADLDREGLGDMPIRTRELAMRLALICTLADTPETPTITLDIIDWCCEYVLFFLHQTLASLRTRVADSETERKNNQILSIIRAAGEHGITNRDLERNKVFKGIPKRERKEAVDSLIAAELIAWTLIEHGHAGRPRMAFVALNEDEAGAEATAILQSAPQVDAA